MAKKVAILENREGAFILVDKGADLKRDPACLVWDPRHVDKEGRALFTILDTIQAGQKWCQWWSIKRRVMEVPGAPESLEGAQAAYY